MPKLFPDINSLKDYQTSDKSETIYSACEALNVIAKQVLDGNGMQNFCVPIEDAPIAGLFNKQRLLFSHFFKSYVEGDSEICAIFNRIIYESYIKMLYLIEHPEEVNNYRACAFKTHLRIFEEIGDNPITYVMKLKFDHALKSNKLTIEDIRNAPKSLGNKSFFDLQKEFISEKSYAPLYAQPSDCLHSGWNDIRQYYLFYDDESENFILDSDYHAPLKLHYLIAMADLFFCGLREFLSFLKGKGLTLVESKLNFLIEIHNILNWGFEDAMSIYENDPESLL